MTCKNCGNYELRKMVESGKPYGYAGDVPCFRCKRYKELQDLHTCPEKEQR